MNPYFEQSILAASPIELVRLLYGKAISAVRDAREHLQARRIGERAASVNSAYAVIQELNSALDPKAAPELAARLGQLYAYMQQRLIEANLNQTEEPLTEVIQLLTTLQEAWAALPESTSQAETPEAQATPSPRPAQSESRWSGYDSEEAAPRLVVSA